MDCRRGESCWALLDAGGIGPHFVAKYEGSLCPAVDVDTLHDGDDMSDKGLLTKEDYAFQVT